VSPAEVVLLAANAVYGTSYVAMQLAVDDVGPVTLAFLRLAIACAILIPICFGLRKAGPGPPSGGDRRTFFYRFGATPARPRAPCAPPSRAWSRRRRASAKTASNIGHVSRPVCVFWRLGW
jgi:EamA-like transporter family